MFEKVYAARVDAPLWLRTGGISASIVAHAVLVALLASVPVRHTAEPPSVEEVTYLVLTRAPRVPDSPSPESEPPTPAPAPPREERAAATPGALAMEDGEAQVEEPVQPVDPVPVPEPADSGGAAGALPEAAPTLAIAASGGAAASGAEAAISTLLPATKEEGVVAGEALAEYPEMVNRSEMQRVLGRLYPWRLRNRGIEGSVLVTFIIGLDGRVELRSMQVLSAAHADLVGPTLRGLLRARFRPARLQGEPVRVRVSLPVSWTLAELM